MEETAEGLAKAAATREAAKRKRSELEANGVVDEPIAKKVVAPPQAISHEVALPEDFVSECDAQPDVYGMRNNRLLPFSLCTRPLTLACMLQDHFSSLISKARWPRRIPSHLTHSRARPLHAW